MPANVTPEYKKAQDAFRKARDSSDRLHWLKEMLRTIPKHKGTEHLQADIKTRIKELTDELTQPRRKGARTGPLHSVPPEGAAQVALVGPPNAGKSTLHARLTGSHAEIGPYPLTTRAPLPGMLPFEDIHFQLVDLPPLSAEFMEPWMPNALQPAHAALLVVDLSVPGCVEDVAAIRDRLIEKRIVLSETWPIPLEGAETPATGTEPAELPANDMAEAADEEEVEDPFQLRLPTLLVANKSDLNPDPEEVRVLEELIGVRYPFLAISAETRRRTRSHRLPPLPGTGRRPGLHEDSGPAAGHEKPLHRLRRRDRRRRRQPGPPGHGRFAAVRADLGQRTVRRTARRQGPSCQRRRRPRTARLRGPFQGLAVAGPGDSSNPSGNTGLSPSGGPRPGEIRRSGKLPRPGCAGRQPRRMNRGAPRAASPTSPICPAPVTDSRSPSRPGSA